MASMITLLEETSEQQRAWIRDGTPSVAQMLEKFPCLSDPQIVS